MTDSVYMDVSIADGARRAAGAGVALDHGLESAGGLLSLRGSLGLEDVLDEHTAAVVSGTTLRSQVPPTRVKLGLGAGWRAGSAVLATDHSAEGLGSDDVAFLASLNLNIPF